MKKKFCTRRPICLILSVFLLSFQMIWSQSIRGTVTDNGTGETLAGVSIQEQGTTNGTTTDADGNYELTLTSTTAKLIFSYVGFTSKTIDINGVTELNVTLDAGSVLDEVVVTALGVNRDKRSLG